MDMNVNVITKVNNKGVENMAITINSVVEFEATEQDAKSVPFLQKDDTVRGIVMGCTRGTELGNDSKAIVTAIVGNHFYKFYKSESDLTVVEK